MSEIKEDIATHQEHCIEPDETSHDRFDPASYAVGIRTFLAILALALANCNATLSNTTNTIIKFQVESVGGAEEASWIANSSFLLTLACAPIFGSLADRVGKKWFIVCGCLLGVTGSFISSAASSVYVLIAGNTLVGIANAGCIVSIAANQEIIPNKLRPYAFSFSQTINSLAAIAGTFLAGAFAQYATWRWSYRLNGIIFATSGFAVLATYHPPPTTIRRSNTLQEIFSSIDYIGMVLLAGSLACIVIGLTWGGGAYAWSSAMIIGTLAGGFVGLVAFGIFEWTVKKSDALLDHRLFKNNNFPILCFVCLIDGMLLLGINVLYAQEIPDLWDADPIRISVILSPYLITSTVGCIPAGWIMGKTKSYRMLLIIALVWCGLFTGLMALINSQRLNWAFAFSALFGLGTAVTTVLPIVALTLSVPSFLLGTAATLSISARALGGITGITIFTTIYNNRYTTVLPQNVANALSSFEISQNITSEVLKALSSGAPPAAALSSIRTLSKSEIQLIMRGITNANTESWKWVWVAIACIIVINAISCCFLKSVKSSMTSHVESALEHSDIREQQLKGNPRF